MGEALRRSGEAALALQKERAGLRHDLAAAAARSPELQEQKQLAVAARSFKEAARLAGANPDPHPNPNPKP